MSNNQPAFPFVRPVVPEGSTYDKSIVVSDGMTLRDYFAASAGPDDIAEYWAPNTSRAEALYRFADEMLKAREVKA